MAFIYVLIFVADLKGYCSVFWLTYLHKCPAVAPVLVMTRLNISCSVYGVWNALLETIHFAAQEEAGFNLNPTHFTGSSKKKKSGFKYDVKARCCIQTQAATVSVTDDCGENPLQRLRLLLESNTIRATLSKIHTRL